MAAPFWTPGLGLVGVGFVLTTGLGGAVVVPRMGDTLAAALGRAAVALPKPPQIDDAELDTAIVVPNSPVLHPGTLGTDPDPGKKSAGPRPTPHVDSIDIPADRLAKLTEKQLRGVGASDAVDASGHAVGARLRGVGRLGVGLADGDVVSSIDGRATPTAAEATGAAMGAYASGEATVQATLLRGGRTVVVTVHVPGR